ncbi:hypothetical protein A2U01_0106298, partial [Trifolium medium]|nr:hypothetical protein [Trifolium medium]
RRSFSNGRNSLWQLRVAQPGMARRAIESRHCKDGAGVYKRSTG